MIREELPSSTLGGEKMEFFGMDRWMTSNFTSFLIVFQSYQDNGWMIMKDCVQSNPVYD